MNFGKALPKCFSLRSFISFAPCRDVRWSSNVIDHPINYLG